MAALIIVFQILPYPLIYICAPAYIVPLFKNPVALTVVGVLLVWEVLGICWRVYVRPRSEFLSTLQWLTVCLIFILPGFLAPYLGPAIVTILNALGPIFN